MRRRTAALLIVLSVVVCWDRAKVYSFEGQTRPASSDANLQQWLENMVWHHKFSIAEICDVTGLTADEVSARLTEFGISESNRPDRAANKVFVLPYPGGRHPRIGFLDGAIDPQRETKLSAFCPWDDHSYAVLDLPEAIWSNLGLTYLAHTHIDTIWTTQGIDLPQQEWTVNPDGSFVMQRTLPASGNAESQAADSPIVGAGIEFGTKVIPMKDHLRMKMWLKNGTDQTLTDLRVQNCVMLKGMEGFDQQTSENKLFLNGYAVAGSADRTRWIITAWDPVHRAWGNAPCPCLHSDPKFADCPPGKMSWLRGWFSFFEGEDIHAELARIEATGWRNHPLHHVTDNVVGKVTDATTGKLIPCRLYVQNVDDGQWHFATSTAVAGSAVHYSKQIATTASEEQHTTLSADGFQLQLPAGKYRIRAERGKEYIPAETLLTVEEGSERTSVKLTLKRFVDMPARGWYSGDTHVHRAMEDLPNLVLAEDVNVVFPLTYWVRDSTEIPSTGADVIEPVVMSVDDTHVIYPVNTEYEIFTVNRKRHTQGAVFVLNHQTPLNLPAPPVLPVAEEARRQNAILDLDKHSWNWSMMIVPVMGVDLFELSNNHHWRTQFGFPQWTLQNAPKNWPEIETTDAGFTEMGWTEFGLQTYYTLLNCGFRLRVTGGTGAGVHPVPLAHGRVYVHCGSSFDYQQWVKQLNAGHSFVTQGPLLDIRFNNQLPGTSWKRTGVDNEIRVTGTIESLNPLKTIQVIRNGKPAVSIPLQSVVQDDGTHVQKIDVNVPLNGSAWVALRCFEDMPNNKVSFAHTNPVFVDVPDHPVRPEKQRVQFLINRMTEEIERNAGTLSDESLGEFRKARSIYEQIARSAQ